MLTAILIILCAVLPMIAFAGGFITALFFAKHIFNYYKRDQNIKPDTFPFLSVFREQGLTQDEKERRLKHAKEKWEKKSKDLLKEHI